MHGRCIYDKIGIMRKHGTINARTVEAMEKARADMSAFESSYIETLRAGEREARLPGLHVRLAASFGFCDGVRRAIEIAFAASHAFAGRRISLIGDIVHSPIVNQRLAEKGIEHLPWSIDGSGLGHLTPEDVVIVPAFGISTELRQRLEERGVLLVDSTCGNVVKVWQRVGAYAAAGITTIIHGKVRHEECMATASHARGADGAGHFLVLGSEAEAAYVAEYIARGGERAAFLQRMGGGCSPGFDPDIHLADIGMANQTTMLRDESLRIQHLLREAVVARDGTDTRFHAFNTICSATHERQQGLLALLDMPEIETVFIVGGYNSSNTTHLAQLAAARKPTFFIRDAACLRSLDQVCAYCPRLQTELSVPLPPEASSPSGLWHVGITAGASCPAGVIECVIHRLAELRKKVLKNP